MDWERFCALAHRANIRPQQRWKTPYADVLIGDRIAYTDGDDGFTRVPLVETFWFLSHAGAHIGRPIRYASFFREDGSYITPQDRFNEALTDALGFLSSYVQSGGLGQQAVCVDQCKLIPWNIDPVRQVITGGVMNGVLHG